MSRSARSYQREIRILKDVIRAAQWVQPMYNGSPSCSGCGAQKHHGCEPGCDVAKVTGDVGEFDRSRVGAL